MEYQALSTVAEQAASAGFSIFIALVVLLNLSRVLRFLDGIVSLFFRR